MYNGKKIEPHMVLDETASQNLTEQAEEWKPSKLNETISNQNKSKKADKPVQETLCVKGKYKASSHKFKEGKWVVKLERINVL